MELRTRPRGTRFAAHFQLQGPHTQMQTGQLTNFQTSIYLRDYCARKCLRMTSYHRGHFAKSK